MITGLDVEKAQNELQEKTLKIIQIETAYTWASRSIAAYRYCTAAYQAGQRVQAELWRHDAEEYAHEAIEHAALADDMAVFQAIMTILNQYKTP